MNEEWLCGCGYCRSCLYHLCSTIACQCRRGCCGRRCRHGGAVVVAVAVSIKQGTWTKRYDASFLAPPNTTTRTARPNIHDHSLTI